SAMTRRRRLLLGMAAALSLTTSLAVVATLFPPPGVNRAQFHRIRNGMTVREITARLGVEPIDLDGCKLWQGERNRIIVGFSENGGATEKLFKEWRPRTNDTWWERAKDWLGW